MVDFPQGGAQPQQDWHNQPQELGAIGDDGLQDGLVVEYPCGDDGQDNADDDQPEGNHLFGEVRELSFGEEHVAE